MKILTLLISSAIFFKILPIDFELISQPNDFKITEGSEAEVCDKIITIDGFWINNYETIVDMSIYSDRLWKPITGGYRKGDTIDFAKDCRYYVVSISKHGLFKKGIVKFSASPEVLQINSYPNDFKMNLNERYQFGEEEWLVENIFIDSAIIHIVKENKINNTIYLKKYDIVWFGENAFSVTKLNETSDNIEMNKVRDYSYINFPLIPGEMINKALNEPVSGEELIIRKMRLYPKMRIDEEECKNTPVKYWVLKIYYYHRGIASPVIKITRNGKDRMVEFSGYKSFDSEKEVMEFARLNNINDVILE